MSIVITYGTFDLFHIGHVRILERARSLGDKLIVGISNDAFNAKKGKVSCTSYEHRAEIVRACRYVDLVIPEECWEQKAHDIKKYNIDILTMGDDWIGKFDYLSRLCKVHYFSRTPGISTTLLKQTVCNGTDSRVGSSLVSQVVIADEIGVNS
ncbi:adenylyltransferase/cytidyltransferase family protein [Acetobacter orientalis]|uniref:Glycerol-3-phosphate cytidyltransferase n=1 Tax=Acetobacter orientalis TaxID=146474 RepID=A0A0D6NKQ1_9PROT|nr:adenylyltransferase/cytidyltransferase family protein [Acetobacter orientalis]GAN65946.1 glycerol-3-phosphate cytidyltransferase [Acetobacter orientalis]GBR20157.1 glycerol-3-phosphate cytidyltransferase [Acetobacter orientalis NRIC 0481]GEL60380.1 hypothetical protein AOR02nite_02220 [Acetobacter orientalis]